jgi:tetratricopeptide (TPR) repeat protein
MARAFLSHSSEDKAYVDIVARRLSRSRVVYDRQDFEPGVDFRDSIRKGLDSSSIFVLFASVRSLASTWVKFEIDEAETRRIAGRLKSVLVVVIDRSIKPSDLPLWMQKGLFCPQTRPSQAARLMLSKLMQQEGADQQTLFVGREELLGEVARQLPPPGGLPAPQVLVFSGLEGVGRRSVAGRALKDNLSLSFGPVLLLEDTDDLDKLYLQLLEDTNLFTTRDQYKKAIETFRTASVPEQAKMIAREIDGIAKDNAAPVIVDQGSLIQESGMFTDSVSAVFKEVIASPAEPYVIVVQRRRPPMAQTTGSSRIASFAVPPLTLDATRRLLVQTLKSTTGKTPDENTAQELTPYLDGYPPAVQLAVAYSLRYGLDALIADKSSLIDHKVKTFERVLTKLHLDATDQLILRVLGMEPGLSLDVLATIVNASTTELVPRVTRLMDHSVIVRYSDVFSLAAPMRDSVYREFGIITPAEYSVFAQRLKSLYWKDATMVPSLDAIDATLYTVARANAKELEEFSDIVLPSMLLKIANAAYHERHWKEARDFAQRAIDADPRPDRGWIILAKAYIRLANEGAADWSQAEGVIAQLKQRGVRVHHYLAGFMSRKRGDFKAAVGHLTQAEKAGDHGVAVYRERAQCKYQLGFVDEAQADIKIALDRYPRNHFILDLAAAIAIRGGKYKKAEELLKDLEEVEHRKENYYHRLATLYAARGQFDRALDEANRAALRNPPLHEILTTRIDILIELKRYDDALQELSVVEQQFTGKTAKDVQTGLRCKLHLRQGHWREAEPLYTALHNKDFPVHKSLRAELLRQKAIDMTVAPAERKLAKEESESLVKELTVAGTAFSFVFDEPDDDDS